MNLANHELLCPICTGEANDYERKIWKQAHGVYLLLRTLVRANVDIQQIPYDRRNEEALRAMVAELRVKH